jgi:hypothetical protein
MSEDQKHLTEKRDETRGSVEETVQGLLRKWREQGESLEIHYKTFKTEHEFQGGQLVKWKNGMRNRSAPQLNQPAIVIQVLAEPIYDNELQSGSTYFHEPLDLILGVVDKDGDFLIFHFDKRRFEPYS